MRLDQWRCDRCREKQAMHSVRVWRSCEIGRMTQVTYRDGRCISFGSTCPWKDVMDARRAGARTYGQLLTRRPELRAFVERVRRMEDDDEAFT